MLDTENWWQTLENSEGGSDADDARHWVVVYDELIGGLARAHADLEGDQEAYRRIRRRLREARRRRAHWLRRLG